MKRFRSRAAEEAFARTEVAAANERRRIQEMREIQARQAQEEAKIAAQAENPIRLIDRDVRDEPGFSRVSPDLRNKTRADMDMLHYMAATYRLIGDLKSAEAVEGELFQLTAASSRTLDVSPRYIRPMHEHDVPNAGTIPFSREIAAGAVFSAQDSAQALRHATAQRKPPQAVNYLANRELGRK